MLLEVVEVRVRRGVVIHEVHETLVGSQLKSVHVEACITKFLAVATGAEVVLLNPLQGANDRTTEVLPNDPQVEVARPLHLRVKFRQGLAKKLVTKLNLPLAHLPRSHRIIARCGPQSLFLTKLLLKLLNLRAQKLNPPCAKLIHDVRRDKEVEVETEATEDANHQGSLTYKKSMFQQKWAQSGVKFANQPCIKRIPKRSCQEPSPKYNHKQINPWRQAKWGTKWYPNERRRRRP